MTLFAPHLVNAIRNAFAYQRHDSALETEGCGVISINPDAHEQDGILDTHFGVIAGRKGGLLQGSTFNTFSLEEVKKHFSKKRN